MEGDSQNGLGEGYAGDEDTADGGAAGLNQTRCEQSSGIPTGDGGVEEQDEDTARTGTAGLRGDDDGEEHG